MKYNILDNSFILLAKKAVFWKDNNILIIADVHLGKASHFRKSGLPIPSHLGAADIEKIGDLIEKFRPKSVVFLGDLFHSDHNHEWEKFILWKKKYDEINFYLIEGNHDRGILSHAQNSKLIIQDKLEINGIILTHEPMDKIPDDKYNLCGHIHPGIKIRGKGRQSVKIPCFWFGKNQGILPAFGNLTGNVALKTNNATIFGIFEDKVILL